MWTSQNGSTFGDHRGSFRDPLDYGIVRCTKATPLFEHFLRHRVQGLRLRFQGVDDDVVCFTLPLERLSYHASQRLMISLVQKCSSKVPVPVTPG